MKHILNLLFIFLISLNLQGQTDQQVNQIISQYDQDKLDLRKAEIEIAKNKQLERTNLLAKKYGWPKTIADNDGTVRTLIGATKEETPLYYTTYNLRAVQSTRTNHLHQGGSLGLDLHGQDMTAYIWDQGGIFVDHPEFAIQGGGSRADYNDLAAGSLHSTHVTGTLIARGANSAALGMAPEAHSKNYDWNGDYLEAWVNAQNNGMLISNHSYGLFNPNVPDYYFGAYIEDSRLFDDLMYNTPFYLMVVAAGNDGELELNGQPFFPGMDQLTNFQTAKNNLVVANVHDVMSNTEGEINPENVTVNTSSSIGPTDDMRIKPDIAGNGTGVFSTANNLPDGGYTTITGTSMASPNVSGSLLLLQQHYQNLNGYFLKGASLKGLALHTADLLGDGPNPHTGWGLLNAKEAAELISDDPIGSRIKETTLNDQQSHTYTFESNGVDPLLVSISWTDPAGEINEGTVNSNDKALVNDLDVRVYDENSNEYTPYYLWHGGSGIEAFQGDNLSDPYERVDINVPAAGTYTIVVSHKGSLTNQQQDYTLIVSGASEVFSDIVKIEQLDSEQNVDENLSLNVECGDEFTISYRIKDSDCIIDQLGANSPQTILFELNISQFGNLALIPGNGGNAFNQFGLVNVPTDLIDEDGTIVTATFEVTGEIQAEFTNTITVSMHPSNNTVYACNIAEADVTQSPVCKGDLDGDGFINSTDLTLLLAIFGQPVPMCHPGDFDNDELIKINDITSFIAVYGTSCNDGNSTNQEGSNNLSHLSNDINPSELKVLEDILTKDLNKEILVFPNPGNGIFNIQFSSNYTEGTIQVFDMNGQNVLNKTVNNRFDGKIDLQHLPDGMYILNLNSASNSTSKLLIKFK